MLKRRPDGVAYPDVWGVWLLSYWPKGPNQLSRRHWSIIRKEKERALEALMIATAGKYRHPRFAGPCNVDVWRLWGKGQRAMDPDNLKAAVKPLVDGMRRRVWAGKRAGQDIYQGGLGIIENDNPGTLNLEVYQASGRNEHTLGWVRHIQDTFRWRGLYEENDFNQASTLILVEGTLERVDE